MNLEEKNKRGYNKEFIKGIYLNFSKKLIIYILEQNL